MKSQQLLWQERMRAEGKCPRCGALVDIEFYKDKPPKKFINCKRCRKKLISQKKKSEKKCLTNAEERAKRFLVVG